MKYAILFLSLLASPLCEAQSYNEPFRPQFHFSPAKNWTNDPNGLVFYKGEYHLFYQYNPFGDVWGHMSWGHAISPDLVHWQHLSVALAEENGIMIFSGSAVVDRNNSSGLCTGTDCLVAIYTGHTDTLQTQNIAYSNDRGRTWTKYKGNPVIDLHMKDFRDPKVFWHEPSHRWIMVVSLPKEHKVRFFASHDLKQWTPLSDFGPAGSTKGDWECPDLYPLLQDRWMLSININPGAPLGGSGNQYFVGRFDGTKFTNENPASTALWADYGKYFYASTSFNDIPASDGRRIWIGWLSNWQYARDEPTSPFRCIQSIPRVLKLKSMPEGIRLIQEPVAELQSLRTGPIHLANTTVADVNAKLRDFHSDSYEIVARFDGNAAFHLRKGPSEETLVGYDGQLFVDRRKSGNTNFSKDFPGIHRAPLAGPPILHIFVDRSSVEVFGGSGEAVISDRIFPSPQSTSLELSGAGKVVSLDIWKLKSIW
ncbi:MAG: glycoside hydrolase family 32 protein [Bryobacteraceae bacterium]